MSQPRFVHETPFRVLMAAASKNKRVVAWIILSCFSLFSCSCIYSWKRKPLQSIKPEKREQADISAVQTRSGEKIDFNRDPAARIRADSVAGERLFKDVAIEKSKIKNPEFLRYKPPFVLVTTDGNSYRVTSRKSIKDVKDKIILNGYVPLSVPLSDIDFVWVRTVNILATILVDTSVTLAIFFGLFAIGLASTED